MVFVVACWGVGGALLRRLGAPPRTDAWLEAAMAATLGVGAFICAFQVLAIAGWLRAGWVLGAVALGLVLAGLQLRAWARQGAGWGAWRGAMGPKLSRAEGTALAVLVLVALPALLEPLAPPAEFDELMYHLPYARLVAQSGALGIHDWLRYPWFPYNYNLLYAGALLVADDVFTHFLCALAGWLSVAIVWRLGVLHVSRVAGLGAAAIWLGLGDYSNALIDMGVALFVLAACAALWWWRESPPGQGVRWLALAAFFLGVAAGSKYQALIFLPLVAVFVFRRERRPRVWGLALACFLLPCIYWYARNAILTGDPFNPIGARVFGFSNWNPADYREQVWDVRQHASLPSLLLWPLLLVPFHAAWRHAAVRAAAVFCAYAVVVWVLTSAYPRYLAPALPMLSLVAMLGWQTLFGAVVRGCARLLPGRRRAVWLPRALGAVGGVMLAMLAAVSAQQSMQKLAMIAGTPAEREAVLRAHVPGYGVMQYLKANAKGRVYQIALSEAIYYGPNPIYGDALGPWRYADFIPLPPAELARKLAGLGFEAIAITTQLAPGLNTQPGFDQHFALMYEQDGAKAYRILQYAP